LNKFDFLSDFGSSSSESVTPFIISSKKEYLLKLQLLLVKFLGALIDQSYDLSIIVFLSLKVYLWSKKFNHFMEVILLSNIRHSPHVANDRINVGNGYVS
jgi:hypothetical protein